MSNIGQVYLWFRVGMFALVVLFAVVGAVVQTRPRKANVAMLVFGGLVNVLAVLAIVWLSGVALSWMWAAAFALVGGALGWLAGRSAKVAVCGDNAAVSVSGWGVWVVAASYVVATAALLFGAATTFSAAALLLVLAAALSAVSVTFEILKVRAVRSETRATGEAPARGATA